MYITVEALCENINIVEIEFEKKEIYIEIDNNILANLTTLRCSKRDTVLSFETLQAGFIGVNVPKRPVSPFKHQRVIL